MNEHPEIQCIILKVIRFSKKNSFLIACQILYQKGIENHILRAVAVQIVHEGPTRRTRLPNAPNHKRLGAARPDRSLARSRQDPPIA